MMLRSWLGLGLLGALLGGCGGSVTPVDTGASTSGAGGAGGATTSFHCADLNACCSVDPTNPCCMDCGTTGSTLCGGDTGAECAADEYCDFANDQCGGNDAPGLCKKRPLDCPDPVFKPTCGCDGEIHGDECAANLAGTDLNALGGCPPPAGMFGCGASFCSVGSEYCGEILPNGGEPAIFSCNPLPAECGSTPTCGCLFSSVPCGPNCVVTPDGGLEVMCAGV